MFCISANMKIKNEVKKDQVNFLGIKQKVSLI
jgi:hypothetical protein